MELLAGDEGKTVVDSTGRELGVARRVTAGAAFVEPMADLEPPVQGALGWGGDDRETYRLDPARVRTVTDATIELSDP